MLLNPRLSETWRECVLGAEFPDLKDHVWLGTSGTSGNLKMVALARTSLEANARAVNSHLGVTSRDVWLNPLPLFHVGGLGIVVRAALGGGDAGRLEIWSAQEFVRRATAAAATLSSLVPAQVHDLVAAQLSCPASFRAIVVGGGVLTESLYEGAAELGWPLLPSYGMTEAGSQVATQKVGDDFSDWLPLVGPAEAREDEQGVLELRGPSLLTGWMTFDQAGGAHWEDPKTGGWYRTGDRVALRGRKLRVLGRLDDLVKIRGELVDLAALERALQTRVTSGLVVVRSVPDARNGVALHVVAENRAAAGEAEWMMEEIFPPFARPESVAVGFIQRNALGKIMR